MAKKTGRVIEGSIGAWLTPWGGSHIGPKEIAGGAPDELIRSVSFSHQDMTDQGWTRIGTAQLCIQLNAPEAILTEKVDALRAQKQNVLAEAQKKATELEGQIQKLLAITFDA